MLFLSLCCSVLLNLKVVFSYFKSVLGLSFAEVVISV